MQFIPCGFIYRQIHRTPEGSAERESGVLSPPITATSKQDGKRFGKNRAGNSGHSLGKIGYRGNMPFPQAVAGSRHLKPEVESGSYQADNKSRSSKISSTEPSSAELYKTMTDSAILVALGSMGNIL